jgi:RNA polymerase sigma factor (sigma-70 family)
MATHSLHPLLHYLRRLSGGPAGDSDLDDAQLLRRFLTQHDETAFTAIVQRYGAMVWGLCVRRLGETAEAEDAFQATFLVLVRKAPSLHRPQLLGPWLYGVAYRTALKVRGRRARLTARETMLPEHAADISSAEQTEAIWHDLRPVIDEEVNRLPEKYRQPVLLCYLQGLSSEEAAQRLGCAKGTVFSRLSRARDLLRQRLSRRGLGVSAGALLAVLTTNAASRAMPPTALTENTIRMSHSFAAGTAGQSLSAPLAALVEGVLHSMFLSKVKLVVVVLLALGVVGSGAGFVAHRTVAGQPSAKPDRASVLPGGAAAKANEKAIEVEPEEAAPVPPGKPKQDAPEAGAKPGATARIRKWRERLNQQIQYEGIDDPKVILSEALDGLQRRFGITFEINHKAFEANGLADVLQMKITERSSVPPMPNTSFATVLRVILSRLPAEANPVYVLRPDTVEITTKEALRDELGIPRNELRSVLPLVWDVFEGTPISKALASVTETTGYNVVVDSRVAEKVQGKATVQFNNVPVDTAVRLLANMADLSMVRLDNVFYLTTAENAKRLHEEQVRLNYTLPGDELMAKPAAKKPAK